ncbi:primosomal protein N' [Xanthomonas vasicola]|uniref:primosomal protein N' n=2 Tax=Xanthomonas vasicola TaxID=56459 RepID=UPI0001CC0A66|nr:primosomal protein N' [Xanthomonas vasicola]AZR32625.1 primosomal protein N' [Xanthomonas vasicola pv. musacearum NCPPB 4379]KFA05592.1 primosome assembly protein PriA [Xanthomonas vasicola pv. musacearum NCPPB 2005]KFA08170.1 primosome assembly protein PriA [Xanthomonas vasicola pv. musacearum NCPPB 4380]KFA21997.1 primosome assembly protein PriA [Xanthomonas vasicola pv. musacearum NCPPB 4392]MBV6743145.1 primosomal protein N' [Xanthomonas vasicola pv. musacearum NCPPB 2251]
MSSTVATLRVALPVPLPQLFDYLPPADAPLTDQARVGCRVRVPFGPRELVGVVVEIGQLPTADGLRLALAWCDQARLLVDELARSLQWLARYTHAPLGEAQASALPGPLRRGEPLADTHAWAWQLTEAGRSGAASLRAGSRPALLAALLLTGAVGEEQLDPLLPQWREAARSLAKRHYAERVAMPADTISPRPGSGPQLNDEQQAAAAAIRAHSGFATYLLDGVTGSGKTEVYLQAIADCLAAGKQALVLVPEIGLTPQTLGRFRARLGVPVHALHSGLSDGERARVWAAAWRGEAKLIVGTRSAVFTPLPNAGLIVIDEEHDGSYKQQDGIRYHARDFALVRGKALDVPVILGSATPSLESLHNAYSGRYQHLRLSRRAGEARPPRVRVLDVRKRPLKDGLSPEVLAGIGATLARGEQVLVFKNRRGYAPVLLCHDCGWTAACQRCSTPLHQTPMTVHAGGRRLQCHHCGARQPAPLACPACASLALQPQGIGTERLEERLTEAFPDFPVVRIDRSTTQRRDALETQLARLGTDAGILVGTQILAKGHDLPRLTMVVVVGIDEGLFSADFRAAEKLSQQLIQVAGRAGRADRPGEVWLQTHHPEHPLLQTLVNGGYHAFVDAELQQREAAGFPPFAHLALFRAEAKDVAAANQFLLAVRGLTSADPSTQSPAFAAVECYGPMPAPMPRRAGFQRTQLLLSAQQRSALHRLLDTQLPAIYALPQARRVRWSLDVDPIDLY